MIKYSRKGVKQYKLEQSIKRLKFHSALHHGGRRFLYTYLTELPKYLIFSSRLLTYNHGLYP